MGSISHETVEVRVEGCRCSGFVLKVALPRCALPLVHSALLDGFPEVWAATQRAPESRNQGGVPPCIPYAALEATQGQIDGFFSKLPCKCHQNRVASVGD